MNQQDKKRNQAHHSPKVNIRTCNFNHNKDTNHTTTSCILFACLLGRLHYHYANPKIRGGGGKGGHGLTKESRNWSKVQLEE